MCYVKGKPDQILDRREMLRVKLKSLAEESKIIRHEQRRTQGQLHHELWWHRTHELRPETRATHLAYGFIRGMPYERMERNAPGLDDWDKERIRAMVKKYGPKNFVEPECMSK